MESFVGVIDKGHRSIQMAHNIEYAFVKFFLTRTLPELAANVQVQWSNVFLGNQRIGRLLDPVMQEPELRLIGQHQSFLNSLPQITAGIDFAPVLNLGE